ncbi:serine/threonine-protein kinase [Nonomuraea rhizosphaerae]|uniref:serine/threonine-protein kinase n=1 Tax=Nonomuraea rhizosphaerae TaxID=2665663 RepID=UPI001C5D2C42|nr:serine/threonine-protein kinase [Nonomuraea rhizosphaerae]
MSDTTPSMVAGRYRLDERIGSGPMGEVWRGYDSRADWTVAVKMLNTQAATADELRRHAQAVARVIHPNVAMVLDVGDHEGTPFLVMEFLTGESLGEEVAGGGSLPIVEACDLIGQAAAGLEAAHRAGVVHGQIGPDSFRRAGSGVLKVVGFGPAGEPALDDGVRYRAPEVVDGRGGEAAADLYALGCVCYEVLCGRPPFEGTPEEVADLQLDADPEPPSRHRPEISGELDRLVLALLAKDPGARPAGGEPVRRALAAIARPHRPQAAQAAQATASQGGPATASQGGPASVASSVPGALPQSHPAPIPQTGQVAAHLAGPHDLNTSPQHATAAPTGSGAGAPHGNTASGPGEHGPSAWGAAGLGGSGTPGPGGAGVPGPGGAGVPGPGGAGSAGHGGSDMSGRSGSGASEWSGGGEPGQAGDGMAGHARGGTAGQTGAASTGLSASGMPGMSGGGVPGMSRDGASGVPGMGGGGVPGIGGNDASGVPGMSGGGATGPAAGGASRPSGGDTAILPGGAFHEGPPPEALSNRRLFIQLGVALAVIVVVTVGLVLWAGSRGGTPVAAPTPSADVPSTEPAQPTPTPTPTPPPTPSPTRSTSVAPIPQDTGAPNPKGTLANSVPPGGWVKWLGEFDKAVTAQETIGDIEPSAANKAHDKIRKAGRKFLEGHDGPGLNQIADVMRDLRKAQQKGDVPSSGPLADFLNDWKL